MVSHRRYIRLQQAVRSSRKGSIYPAVPRFTTRRGDYVHQRTMRERPRGSNLRPNEEVLCTDQQTLIVDKHSPSSRNQGVFESWLHFFASLRRCQCIIKLTTLSASCAQPRNVGTETSLVPLIYSSTQQPQESVEHVILDLRRA